MNLKQYRQLIYDRIRKIYKSSEEEQATMKTTNSSSGGYIRGSHEQKSSSSHKEENHFYPSSTSSYQNNPPINHHRHSTGKMKTTGGYSFTSHQDSEEKIQKKSSLKEILKNKRSRDEIQKTPSSTISSNYVQKYYRKNGVNAAVYKENKLGRHVWIINYVFQFKYISSLLL